MASPRSMPPGRQKHWDKHALQWQDIGAPLRPGVEDIHIFEEVVAKRARDSRVSSPKALLLGVTPEIAGMRWPAGTQLIAVDQCPAMIAHVWPGDGVPDAVSVLGSWQNLPVRNNGVHLILGDGCFTPLQYPDGYRQVSAALHAALARNGCLVLRFFTRPAEKEELATVIEDLDRGKIGSFHALKWRLAMALHGPTAGDGVCLSDIWQAWNDQCRAGGRTLRGPGWTAGVVATISNYRNVATRYSFPNLEEVRQLFAEFFREDSIHAGSYELAERCPIMVFSPLK